jgi:hypothetical protein
MKTLKLLNFCLLVIAALLLVTAVAAFVNGNIIYGICNILWIGCEILYFLINKKSIEVKQRINQFCGFLSIMNDTIEKYGAAIITENEDGEWRITRGIAVERDNPSCSAENNDNIEFVHNAEGGKE